LTSPGLGSPKSECERQPEAMTAHVILAESYCVFTCRTLTNVSFAFFQLLDTNSGECEQLLALQQLLEMVGEVRMTKWVFTNEPSWSAIGAARGLKQQQITIYEGACSGEKPDRMLGVKCVKRDVPAKKSQETRVRGHISRALPRVPPFLSSATPPPALMASLLDPAGRGAPLIFLLTYFCWQPAPKQLSSGSE